MSPLQTASHAQLLADTLDAIQAIPRTPIPEPLTPYGMLGVWGERLCAVQGTAKPSIAKRAVCIFAADHGVAEEGVSLYPQQVTCQMMHNFVGGGAGINAFSRVAKARLQLVDMAVKGDFSDLYATGKILDEKIAWGSNNITKGPAMTRKQALRALATGIALSRQLAAEHDILIAGEKGIGNTTPSAAVVSVLLEADPKVVTGRGTGLDEQGRKRKAGLVAHAISLNQADPQDPIDVLSKLGGYDMAAMAGFYLGAAACGKMVILDGFISGAAALIANRLHPHCCDYFLAGHRSAEQGHTMVLSELGLHPILDLEFRLGEATGATLALTILDSAVALL